LLLARQGRDEQAIAEFRRGILAATIDLPAQHQLARALLRLGRACEAAAALRPLMDARLLSIANTTTPTELQELLAQAWDAAGEPDSALVHYAAVAESWQHADPVLRSRVDAVRARMAALQSARARRGEQQAEKR
jgi:predicted Zn-dependent protease